jgi:hypothetical protein
VRADEDDRPRSNTVTKTRNVRPLVRLVSTLIGLAMLALPAVAAAGDGTELEYEGPLETTSVSFPLLGSPLTIDVAVTDGAISSISFTPDPGFTPSDEDDDDFTFLFESDGVVYEVEIQAEDGRLSIEFEVEDDEGDDEGDDDEGFDDLSDDLDDDDDEDDEDDDEDDDDDDEDDDDDDD